MGFNHWPPQPLITPLISSTPFFYLSSTPSFYSSIIVWFLVFPVIFVTSRIIPFLTPYLQSSLAISTLSCISCTLSHTLNRLTYLYLHFSTLIFISISYLLLTFTAACMHVYHVTSAFPNRVNILWILASIYNHIPLIYRRIALT